MVLGDFLIWLLSALTCASIGWAVVCLSTKICLIRRRRAITFGRDQGRHARPAEQADYLRALHRLPPEQTRRATIKIIGGPVYTAIEIARLHYRPKLA